MMRRQTSAWMLVAVAMASGTLGAAPLDVRTLAGWDTYVAAIEARIAREIESGQGFLAADFARSRPLDRRALTSGAIDVVKVNAPGDAGGAAIEVPEGLVHHWRGVVFVPGITVDRVLAHVANPEAAHVAQEDVVAARVLSRGPGTLRLFLRLQRRQIVTVVYNTEHTVRYRRHGDGRASSDSIATRIAEVADPGTPRERERAPGDDRGFLWRLHSYWRYQQVPGGVLVECESISLSRAVPTLVGGVVRPVIDQVASASMERTLAALRARLTGAPLHGA